MKHLVIGMGEVGSALFEVLYEKYDVTGIDKDQYPPDAFDVIHICIPYNAQFNDDVKTYLGRHQKLLGMVIIHSTVPIGTSRIHGAVHSPIRGVHPNLAEGIRTFVKFFGGPRSCAAGDIFRQLGIPVHCTEKSENTEAMKLWDTTYYGWNIVFEKAVHEYCEKHGLDFDLVYRQGNLSYNKGYKDLGVTNVQRPVLKHKPGNIGGHCVIPNARILGGDIADFIRERNVAHFMKEAA